MTSLTLALRKACLRILTSRLHPRHPLTVPGLSWSNWALHNEIFGRNVDIHRSMCYLILPYVIYGPQLIACSLGRRLSYDLVDIFKPPQRSSSVPLLGQTQGISVSRKLRRELSSSVPSDAEDCRGCGPISAIDADIDIRKACERRILCTEQTQRVIRCFRDNTGSQCTGCEPQYFILLGTSSSTEGSEQTVKAVDSSFPDASLLV